MRTIDRGKSLKPACKAGARLYHFFKTGLASHVASINHQDLFNYARLAENRIPIMTTGLDDTDKESIAYIKRVSKRLRDGARDFSDLYPSDVLHHTSRLKNRMQSQEKLAFEIYLDLLERGEMSQIRIYHNPDHPANIDLKIARADTGVPPITA